MNDPMEVEAKFEADDVTLAQILKLEHFGGFRLKEREKVTQDDTYYDTADRHLRRSGATLRIRRKETGARMTFKGARQTGAESHVVSRLEDEVDLASETIAGLDDHTVLELDEHPSPFQRALGLSESHPLRPAARLVTNRTVCLFEDESGTQVEASVDRCTATRLSDGRIVEFSEVELELKSGVSEDLYSAGRLLQEALPGLRPSHETKLKRALD